MEIEKLYKERFSEKERLQKDNMWKVLCSFFLQKYISADCAVLDIGAGCCEFINNIQCAEKYAVDLNKEIYRYANPDVKIFNYPSTNLTFLSDGSIDIVFISNFLEHLKTKEEIIKTLSEAYRVLRQGGSIIIIQPNIRYVYREYWDFFDHYIPLSDKSLIEALGMVGFKIEQVLPKFLPYTTKGKIPKRSFLTKIYLKVPFIWRILGKQMFILAKKIPGSADM